MPDHRIAPQLDADGAPIDLAPPCGGSWIRDADGGLSPADESTAAAAGLAWPAPTAQTKPAAVKAAGQKE